MIQRNPRTDIDRVLLFEWHAAHFKAADQALPEVPRRVNFAGLPPDEWHGLTLRFMLARKFLIGRDSIRLDRVWEVMHTLAGQVVNPSDRLRSNLRTLIDEIWPRKLATAHRVSIDGQPAATGDEWLAELLYGAFLHSDMEKAQRLIKQPRGIISMETWAYWLGTGAEYSVRELILSTHETLTTGRRDGTLDLPDPWPAIWPAPTAEAEQTA